MPGTHTIRIIYMYLVPLNDPHVFCSGSTMMNIRIWMQNSTRCDEVYQVHTAVYWRKYGKSTCSWTYDECMGRGAYTAACIRWDCNGVDSERGGGAGVSCVQTGIRLCRYQFSSYQS